jgi:hypothetical protein
MKIFLSMWLSLCLCLFIGSRIDAYQDGDWQLWSSSSLEGNVHPRWKLKFEEQFRIGHDVSEFYYHLTGIGLTWKPSHWFQAALAYAQVYELKTGDWKEENRPFVDGTLQGRWKDVQLSDRNRLERRLREGAENIWRYRNNVTFSLPNLPKRWLPFDIQPYVSSEIFVDIAAGDFDQYRVTGGLTGRLVEFLQTSLYYLRQGREKDGNWSATHVLGAAIKVAL